jgi:ATP-dependent exoDNAse (exonuclease V) alpha subunit
MGAKLWRRRDRLGRQSNPDSKRQARRLERQDKEDWSKDEYLANGEIGVVSGAKKGFLNVALCAKRADVRFGFSSKQFSSNAAPLELAYALTVHKAQGSEFETVFVVLPEKARFFRGNLFTPH